MLASKFWQSAATGLLLFILAAAAWSDDSVLYTDWMELVKGSRDSTLGAELVEIEDGDTSDTQKITLAIPKESIGDPGAIEEVLVIGKAPEKSEPLDITYEWVSDYDKDNYGLVIRLSRDTNWPIRLYMNSSPGFMR
jgi:hypothetical protein